MLNLRYKSIDVMKFSKDTVENQQTTSEKQNIIAALVLGGASHIAISVPMDTNAQMIAAGKTPDPLDIEDEIREWCDLIHAAGCKVIHRGTLSGFELQGGGGGLYGFPYYEWGTADQLDTGDRDSAATDGENTVCGRVLRYINTTVGSTHWADGDVFAPFPESTGQAFHGGGESPWWDDTVSSPDAFAAAFAEFKAVSDAAFEVMGKLVQYQCHDNYSEVRSGWIPASHFILMGLACIDYYGGYTSSNHVRVQDYIDDIVWVFENKDVPVFWTEWGDLPSAWPAGNQSIDARLNFLNQLYATVTNHLVNTGKLIGFNFWGGWSGQNTSILWDDSGTYRLNARGKALANYYINNSGLIRVPIITAGNTDDTYTY
jgi:hypothetical protein